MAYISASEVKEIRNEIKKQFPAKEGWKFSVKNRHHSNVIITVLTAPFNMLEGLEERESGHNVSLYHIDQYTKEAAAVIEKLETIAKSKGWFDNSDSMTDYFHTAYYIDLKIGDWDKPFVVKEVKTKKAEKVVEATVETIDYSSINDESLANTYEPIEALAEVVVEVEACVEDSETDYWAVLDQPKQQTEVVEAKQAPVEYEKNLEIIETIIREDSNSLSQVVIQLYKGLTHIGSFKTEHAAKKIASYMGTGMYNLICRDGFKFHSSFCVASS